MSFFQALLMGKQIESVHVDSEVTYIILNDGTCVSTGSPTWIRSTMAAPMSRVRGENIASLPLSDWTA
jgi:hypothetical protein